MYGNKKKSLSPSKILLLSFVVIILIGTFFLSLPISCYDGVKQSVLTALFTATSAVSVTGLSVVDVSTTYNYFGKTIILILIQLGGLGIMTFSSIIMLILGKRITYEEKKILKEDLNQENLGGIIKFIKRLVGIVIGIEFAGALLLFIGFRTRYSFWKALYYSVFHSVSAFCNAGFSLFTDSLEGFKSDYLMNFTISFLIIIGGIGFAVVNSYILFFKTGQKKFNLTSKVAIRVSLALLIMGTLAFYFIERNNPSTIGSLSFVDKLTASCFQSVTTRTAGFNTVAIGSLKPASIFIFIILMFIGASPGSTGGGIKTTTFGVIIFYTIGMIKGKKDINISNRRISWQILNRSIAILTISLMYLAVVITVLMMVEEREFTKLVFEAVSAFGTVGLSMGITAELSILSKLMIIVTMLVGRVGPLTFTLAIGENYKKSKIRYPKENILVG
jgi:trk system potassium uptake protein TrkH